jgi:hypothetical protein
LRLKLKEAWSAWMSGLGGGVAWERKKEEQRSEK